MAGGPHAAIVPCHYCVMEKGVAVPAKRTYDGSETDYFKCENGHEFGICYSDDMIEGPPDEPQWPPSEEFLRQAEMIRAQVEGKKKDEKQ